MAFDYKPFDYVSPPGLHSAEPRHPVVIVGAGPIGLAAALELANHGVPSVVLDDNNVVSVGSRAICWSKRSLEILDRIRELAFASGIDHVASFVRNVHPVVLEALLYPAPNLSRVLDSTARIGHAQFVHHLASAFHAGETRHHSLHPLRAAVFALRLHFGTDRAHQDGAELLAGLTSVLVDRH